MGSGRERGSHALACGDSFLHSVMVQEKKGMLEIWNMLLVAGGFVLALFGTS